MVAYHAFAIACAGEIVRPVRQPIRAQAAVVLPATGGHESKQVKNIELSGFGSIGLARSEVGGSYDEIHNSYTSYSSSVLEKFNFCDVVTADRIIVRQSCIQSKDDQKSEPSFSLIGTRVENLKIAGYPVDVPLDISQFWQIDTFSKLEQAYKRGDLHEYVQGSFLPRETERLDHPILNSWREQATRYKRNSHDIPRQYSIANHLDLHSKDISSFGSIIIVPHFGIVSLAELTIGRRHRELSLLRLYLGSPIEGRLDGPTCSVGDDTDSTGPR